MGSSNILEISDDTFEKEVIQSDIPVLVAFMATWCGPCKALKPTIEKVADELEGEIKVGTVDIDKNPQITRKYGIRSVPTCLTFEGGQKYNSHVGLTTRDKLIILIKGY